jgi:hypothetical protein
MRGWVRACPEKGMMQLVKMARARRRENMDENEILALLYGSWEGIFQQDWARDGFSYPVVDPEGFEPVSTFTAIPPPLI